MRERPVDMARTEPADRCLRILQVVSAYYPAVRYGGPVRSVHGLSAALVRRGHEVHVYTTNINGAEDMDVPLDRPVLRDGVAVHYFRVPALRRLWWSPALGRRLRTSAAEFDVIHIHAVFLWPMWAAARIAARLRVPYVLSPRGMLIREVIERKSRRVKTAWIRLIERRTVRDAAAVHITAELEGSELRSLGMAPARIEWIPNGVEVPSSPSPRSAGPFASLPGRYALFLSRISWKKGLDRLITAWQWVPEIPLVIAGNDDEQYRPKLERLAASLGISHRVRFVGPASDEHKWGLYRDAELFVLPSYSENFGNAVAEAMAMACPVVLTPEVGIAPIVQAAGAGIVSEGDPEQLATAIAGLLANPARRREMGRRAENAAKTQLTWDGVAAQMEACYLSVLDALRPARAPR